MLEELQLEKTNLITKEIELSSLQREWENRSCELTMREKELEGKLRLIQAERKAGTQPHFYSRKDTNGIKSPFLDNRSFEQFIPSGPGLEKSLKQLKDEYLRNLGHI